MKTLTELAQEGHVVTETDHGKFCWTCTLATGADTAYPCPTVTRAVELDAMTSPTPPPQEA